ncbi:hypothetical protein HK102_011208 [Quaeritorhiza haematococci]|nr:hypothetical protein HK102_011208 [Quaeritorhiza haematococci]
MVATTTRPTTLTLPTVDLTPYLNDPSSEEALQACQQASTALLTYSALAIRDPRVPPEYNKTFINLMEDYFSQPFSSKVPADTRPELGYQVGVTPECTEVPRCGRDEKCLEWVNGMKEEHRPTEGFDGPDPKWRFFWRIGERPKETMFQELNAEKVVPAAFPQWEEVMNKWGSLMHHAITTLSEMIAIGFGLEKDTFTKMTRYGPHLLAPTGSDLEKYGKVDTVLAGFHYDLNFLTIHGKSRFPGLHIWAKDGRKMLAKVPDGCLLVQAGKQLEWLTGGQVLAGYHEVVVVPETLEAVEKQKALNRPLWRVSSTLFYHISSDEKLRPLGKFAEKEGVEKEYPEVFTGDQVKMELGLINLMK